MRRSSLHEVPIPGTSADEMAATAQVCGRGAQSSIFCLTPPANRQKVGEVTA